MGCNCNKKDLQRVLDADGQGETLEGKSNIFTKIFAFLAQIIGGSIAAAIVLVCVIPLIIYIMVCLIFGKQATIPLRHPKNWFKRRKKAEKE